VELGQEVDQLVLKTRGQCCQRIPRANPSIVSYNDSAGNI
jgi:hypothetical protein